VTVVPVFGGPKKRDIIQRAYGFCGQAAYEFELTPEEYNAGLRAMNDQLAACNCTTYNFPEYGDGNAEDESGLAANDILGVSYYVAQLLAPQIGKTLTASKPASRACDLFLMKWQAIPSVELGRQTPRGAGNRYWNGPLPFFVAPVSEDEPAQ